MIMRPFREFQRRDDLCKPGQSRVLYSKDEGYIVKTRKGWFATNDLRLELVGTASVSDLCQPSCGPHKTAKEAYDAYAAEKKS